MALETRLFFLNSPHYVGGCFKCQAHIYSRARALAFSAAGSIKNRKNHVEKKTLALWRECVREGEATVSVWSQIISEKI